MLVSCLAYSSTLKVKATCSSETSVDFQWSIQPYIAGDETLQKYPRLEENLLIYLKSSHFNVIYILVLPSQMQLCISYSPSMLHVSAVSNHHKTTIYLAETITLYFPLYLK
jgi:hypothetical protein